MYIGCEEGGGKRKFALLTSVFRISLIEKVTFEQRVEADDF